MKWLSLYGCRFSTVLWGMTLAQRLTAGLTERFVSRWGTQRNVVKHDNRPCVSQWETSESCSTDLGASPSSHLWLTAALLSQSKMLLKEREAVSVWEDGQRPKPDTRSGFYWMFGKSLVEMDGSEPDNGIEKWSKISGRHDNTTENLERVPGHIHAGSSVG